LGLTGKPATRFATPQPVSLTAVSEVLEYQGLRAVRVCLSGRPAAAIINSAAGPWISAPEPHDLPISVL
jgi:hypothetical protein